MLLRQHTRPGLLPRQRHLPFLALNLEWYTPRLGGGRILEACYIKYDHDEDATDTTGTRVRTTETSRTGTVTHVASHTTQ